MYCGKLMSLVGTLLLTVGTAQSVHADIVKDTLSGFAGDIPYHTIPGMYEPTFKSSLGITFNGNDQQVGLISFVARFDWGDSTPNNHPDEGEFTIRAGFHSSTSIYENDPFAWAPEQPNYFHEFSTAQIVNPGWQTPIGTATYLDEPGEVHSLYLITIDATGFNWMTTAGQTHVISLSLDGQWITPGIVPYFAPTTISSGLEDWWGSTSQLLGYPDTLTGNDFYTWGTNAAVQVQTHVPEPGSLCLLGAALLCKGRRRRDDCRCVKQAPAISTKATHIGPP